MKFVMQVSEQGNAYAYLTITHVLYTTPRGCSVYRRNMRAMQREDHDDVIRTALFYIIFA